MYVEKASVTMGLLILGVVLNVIFNIPFIYLWGAVGAAWATFLASLLSTCIGFVIAQKYYRIQWERLKILAILILFSSVVIISITLHALEADYFVRLLFKIIGIGGFVFLGVKIGVLSRNNLNDLRAAIVPVRHSPVSDLPSQ